MLIGLHNIGYKVHDLKFYSLKNEYVESDNFTNENQNPAFVNNNTEQFSVIDKSRRQERTFSFITDFFNSLFYSNSCITPCTVTAFQQNRCCLTVIVPPPLPQVCCSTSPIRPQLPPPPPRQPPIIVVPPVYIPPINCCNMCTYNYYGPPPCYNPYGATRTGSYFNSIG
ncbi:uncharacterized protein LOC119667229 [Teleopsis dalmanni]|uniref:uncharacterized protein LOC119667229 n=1 Tax=Teleopsis dalmanni TaxID=139649 RepID=UPI0018CC8EF6|nr:uncharacterized protein LOC119667229 [Teleopsis dalmanni]